MLVMFLLVGVISEYENGNDLKAILDERRCPKPVNFVGFSVEFCRHGLVNRSDILRTVPLLATIAL